MNIGARIKACAARALNTIRNIWSKIMTEVSLPSGIIDAATALVEQARRLTAAYLAMPHKLDALIEKSREEGRAEASGAAAEELARLSAEVDDLRSKVATPEETAAAMSALRDINDVTKQLLVQADAFPFEVDKRIDGSDAGKWPDGDSNYLVKQMLGDPAEIDELKAQVAARDAEIASLKAQLGDPQP